jgi:hypothetical protein
MSAAREAEVAEEALQGYSSAQELGSHNRLMVEGGIVCH